ncbi:hypothetical protein [Streptomyces sp. NPDC018693]
MSRAARVHLGLTPNRSPLLLHTIAGWLTMVLGTCGYITTVLALADQVPK